MNFLKKLKEIKELYSQGKNIVEYIKNESGSDENLLELILISYYIQSGSYIEFSKKNQEYIYIFTKDLAEIINKFGDFNSLLEVGLGEGVIKFHFRLK